MNDMSLKAKIRNTAKENGRSIAKLTSSLQKKLPVENNLQD